MSTIPPPRNTNMVIHYNISFINDSQKEAYNEIIISNVEGRVTCRRDKTFFCSSPLMITVDEIVRDPWFVKDYKETAGNHQVFDDFEFKFRMDGGGGGREQSLNAFDLISFSSGFDLSRMFNESDIERFISVESPKGIMKRVEEAAKEESVTVTGRYQSGLKLEGRNGG
ncbi:CBL-interacting serine/threonine-protein kinase 11 [Linum perenne]